MRNELRQLIQSAYPGGTYTSRDATLLERGVGEREVEAIADVVRRLGAGDVTVSRDADYDICYRIEIAVPSRDHVFALRRTSGSKAKAVTKPLDQGYLTFLLVSRLDRVFTVYWNVVRCLGDRVATDYYASPPTPEMELLARRIHGILTGSGLERLSAEELREPVPWIAPGDSIVKDGRVTLYHCLFSEI